jgi:hypothetical protein
MEQRALTDSERTVEAIWRLLVSVGMLLALAAGAILAVFSLWIDETRLLVATALALIVLQGFLASLYFVADRSVYRGGLLGMGTAFGLTLFCAAFFVTDAQVLVGVPLVWAIAFGWCSARYRQIGLAIQEPQPAPVAVETPNPTEAGAAAIPDVGSTELFGDDTADGEIMQLA